MKRSDVGSIPQDVLDKLGDRYSDIKYVSRGATSNVFSAHDRILDKRIALKVLTPSRPEDFIRFQKEAKAASQLDHPNLVKILNFDVTSCNHAYLIMDYVDGDDLDYIVQRESRLSVELALEIALQICQAMQHAHQKQIAHRDLKASNIIVTNFGQPTMHVTVVDFGLARVEVQEPSGRTTPSGSIQGSPRYMSPEQAQGKSGDVRSDIYALGCIIFKMITGDAPFDDKELIGILHQHISAKPPKLGDRTAAIVPDILEAIVGKMLEKEPQKRYQRMSDVHAALEPIRFPDVDSESVPAFQQQNDPNGPMTLRWMFLAIPVVLGLIFLLRFSAQTSVESTRSGSFESAASKEPSKFALESVDLDEPRKGKLLLTKSGEGAITDDDLKHIGELLTPDCQGIDLTTFDDVKGDGIMYLRNLKIHCVNAVGVKLNAAGWKNLSQVSTLKQVVLERSNVTDVDLKNFENHAGIYMLIMDHCPGITDSGMRSVATIKHISKLDLTGTKVTDEGMKALSNCRELGRIFLEGTKVGDRGIKNLKPAPALLNLHLANCPRVTGESLKFIAKTWPNVSSLEIGGQTPIQTKDLGYLRTLKKMQHLHTTGIVLTDKEMQMFGTFSNLRELYISNGRFSSQSLTCLYPLKNLKTVSFLGCSGLEEESLSALRKQLSPQGCTVLCPTILPKREETPLLPDALEATYEKGD